MRLKKNVVPLHISLQPTIESQDVVWFDSGGGRHRCHIVHIINNFFDVCDSRIKYDKSLNKFKCGFGVYEEEQCQALQEMIDLMTSLEWRRRGF